MPVVVTITGASGSLYAQRLLDNLDPSLHEVSVILSQYAQAVISHELPGGLRLPKAGREAPGGRFSWGVGCRAARLATLHVDVYSARAGNSIYHLSRRARGGASHDTADFP